MPRCAIRSISRRWDVTNDSHEQAGSFRTRLSGAALRPAAALGRRLGRADERARELAFDLRRDRIDVDAGFGEKRARVGDVVDAPRFELDAGEPGRLQLR